MRYEDLTGQTFDMLTVLRPTGARRNGYIEYRCRCECGNEISIGANSLRQKYRHSCGCLKRSSSLAPGVKINHLVAVAPDRSDCRLWTFRCDCGKELRILKHGVLRGTTKTCGGADCPYHEAALQERNTSHGMSRTKFYEMYRGMLKRCHDPNAINYPDYGGRGIEVCEEWKADFKKFYEWAISSGWEEGLTIDRIDVNGHYSPSNCRWATVKDQNRNKRTSKMLTFEGETKTAVEWAELMGIPPKTLYERLRIGMSVEKALTMPVRRKVNEFH